MLNLVVTLLIIALIAAVLGFGGIAGAAVGIAKIVFLGRAAVVCRRRDRGDDPDSLTPDISPIFSEAEKHSERRPRNFPASTAFALTTDPDRGDTPCIR